MDERTATSRGAGSRPVETDPVTGARTRAAGLLDLEDHAKDCHLIGRPLVAVYGDVVGLKALSDSADMTPAARCSPT